MPLDLRLGDYRDVLRDVECDALICDPPFSARTHEGHRGTTGNPGVDGFQRRPISYTAWTPADVAEFVAFWAQRTRGWMVCMTDSELASYYYTAYEAAGLYVFAPVWVVQNSVRLSGDGPASPGIYVMVARPKNQRFSRWGALPGHYVSHRESGRRIGGKPIGLMREIVRDYSREGDLICDPCAGFGSTLVAALQCGRRAVGAEIDPEAYRAAVGAELELPDGQLVML